MLECEKAVEHMKSNKYAGQDGLTAELYKIFWNDLKDLYYASLLRSIQVGMLPFSQRNAIISLISKKGNKDNFKKL